MRAEDEWMDEPPTMTTGSVTVSSESESSGLTDIAAVLWVPDIEQRYGWREFYVKRSQPKPGSRPVGFRR